MIPFFRTAILRITVYPSSGACNRFPIHVIPSLCQSYVSLSTASGVPAALLPAFIRNPFFSSWFFLSAAEPHCVVFLYKNRKILQLSSFTAISSCENKNARETLSLTNYSLSMGTAILINKTFLTSEYKLNSRVRHYWSGLLNALSSGSEQKSITHILYRFSILSSIHICVVSMNLYYILCKCINQYNMLIHSIFHIRNLHILFSTEGIFHFVVYRELILQGSSDQRLLRFILLPETGDYSPVFTYLPWR